MKHAKPPHQVDSHTGGSFEIPSPQDSNHTSSHFAKTQAAGFEIPNKDSRIFDKNAQNVFSPNADRRQDFGDKNGALQGDSRAHTRAYVTAESQQQNKGYRSALADVSLESPFLAQKPTPKPSKAESKAKHPRLCGCVEFIYTGKEPYTLRLTSGESFSLKPKEHFIIPRGTLARWCEYKTTLFTKA